MNETILKWRQDLEVTLKDLFPMSPSETANRDDKLAYLAYTGKVENFVRDELAYALHSAAQLGKLSVQGPIGREFKRTDLVAFNGNQGRQSMCALEIKAMYLGDLLDAQTATGNPVWRAQPHALLTALASDVLLKVESEPSQVETAGLMLVSDVRSTGALLPTIKYANQVKRQAGLDLLMDATTLHSRVEHLMSGLGLSIEGSGSWAGRAFGGDVVIWWFLLFSQKSGISRD